MPLWGIFTFAPLRWTLTWSTLIVYLFIVQFILLGTKPGQPLGNFRISLINFFIHNLGFLHFFGSGVLKCTKTNPILDYKKYLGPDWKPKFEGAGL